MAGRQHLNKNALSAFEEYGVQKRRPPKVEIIESNGPDHKPKFVATAKLGDDDICKETGKSKLEARLKAAERALQILSIQDGALPTCAPPVPSPSKGAGDSIKEEVDLKDINNPIPYKDPVSALMEYGQYAKSNVVFKPLAQEGPPHMPIFTMCAYVGEEKFPDVKGSSSKETKKHAACVVLNQLKREGRLRELFPDGASLLPSTKIKSKSALAVPGKNPVSVLNEYAQKVSKRLVFDSIQSGASHKPVFRVKAVLGDEEFPEVEACNKKEGNVMAAEKAMQVLGERGEYVQPRLIRGQNPGVQASSIPNPLSENISHADRMMRIAMTKMEELLLQTPESLVGRKVVAAIIMTDSETKVSRAVSIGSGNRCIRGNFMTDNGMVIHDSHAEILARRGFIRFLYMLLSNDPHGLLTRTPTGRKVFKPHITFHMYISTAPCGDGALFSHSDKTVSNSPGSEHQPVFNNTRTQGLLRAKQENGEGTIPIEEDCPGQTYDGVQQGARLRIMSCSDKICQWNVVGLQGSLLSRIYQPIYLESLTLGSLFNAGHLARALCCRVDYMMDTKLQHQLPAGYLVNHPDLAVTTTDDVCRAVKAGSLSINWCMGDDAPEITDGTTGQTVQTVNMRSHASRLCKKALLALHRSVVCKLAENNMTYRQIKLDSDEYNQAKTLFQLRMYQQGYGTWVSMPKEVNRFL